MPTPTVTPPAGDIIITPEAGAGVAHLFTEHQPELFRYCRSIVRDQHDAEDAVQIALLKAMLHGPVAPGELRPWLFRVAHNEAVSILRARRPAESIEVASPAAPGELSQTVEHRVRLAAVHGDLRDLTERQRVALVLREYHGCSHEQIAGRLGVTPRAVKQLIFEARSALHVCEEGRDLVCADVRSMLSGADGRVLRGRRVRAHLRTCRGCRAFRRQGRHSAVGALLPLLTGGFVSRAWASVKGVFAGLAGGSAGGVVSVKLAVTVAVVASAGGVAVVQPELGTSSGAGVPSSPAAAAPGTFGQPLGTPLQFAAEPALVRRPTAGARGARGRADRAAARDGGDPAAGGAAPSPSAGATPGAPAAIPATPDRSTSAGTTSEPGASATTPAAVRDTPAAVPGPAQGAPADPGPPASAGPPADPPGQSGAAPGQSGAAPGQSGEAPGQAEAPPARPADPGPPAEPPAAKQAPPAAGPPPSPGQSDAAPGPPGETPGRGSRK